MVSLIDEIVVNDSKLETGKPFRTKNLEIVEVLSPSGRRRQEVIYTNVITLAEKIFHAVLFH